MKNYYAAYLNDEITMEEAYVRAFNEMDDCRDQPIRLADLLAQVQSISSHLAPKYLVDNGYTIVDGKWVKR